MNANLNGKLPAAATSLAIALIVVACAAPMHQAYYYTPPPVGSSYVEARHDTGSYGSRDATIAIKRGERMWQGEKLVAYEFGQSGALLTRPDGGWVAIVRGDTPIISWNPPLNWEYPLEVGKTWNKSQSLTIHATKQTIPFSYTAKVEAYEDVTVPAGTFKAYRVHSTNTLGEEHTTWLSPELGIFIKQHLVRTAKSAQGPGTRDDELVSQNIVK